MHPSVRFQSPLQRMEINYGQHAHTIHINNAVETIEAFPCSPWKLRAKTIIARSPLEAEAQHCLIRTAQKSQRITEYPDGSGIQQRRAAAASLPQLTQHSFSQYMGTKKDMTVYGTELYGIRLALEAVKEWIRSGHSDPNFELKTTLLDPTTHLRILCFCREPPP